MPANLSPVYVKPVMKPFPVRLTERQLAALQMIAAGRERSMGKIVRDAVDLYIEAYYAPKNPTAP